MKFEFNDGFLLAGGKVIAEINALEENSIDTLFDSKKNGLREKYEILLKDYALEKHKCNQKEEQIRKLEKEIESLLKKNTELCERITSLKSDNETLHEIIGRIRGLIEQRQA